MNSVAIRLRDKSWQCRQLSKVNARYGRPILILGTAVWICAAVAIFSGLFANADYTDPRIIQTYQADAGLYRSFALLLCDAPDMIYSTISEAFNSIVGIVGLNWITLPAFGALACRISHDNFDYIVVLVNAMLFSLMMRWFKKSLDALDAPLRVSALCLLPILLPTLVWQMIGLNKEILSYAAVAAMAYFYMTNRMLSLAIVSVLFAPFRVQLLPIAILLLIKRGVRVPIGVSFVVISIVNSFLPQPDLTAFYDRDEQVNSQALMESLHALDSIPFGLIVSGSVRTVLNLVSALSALPRCVGGWEYCTAISGVSGLAMFSVLAIKMIRGRVDINHPMLDVIFAFIVIESIIPFLQYRYLLPIMPLGAIVLMTSRPRAYIVSEDGTGARGVAA